MTLSVHQAEAISGLMKEIDAQSASVGDLEHDTLAVTLFRDDDTTPAWQGCVSVAGTVREWATVKA